MKALMVVEQDTSGFTIVKTRFSVAISLALLLESLIVQTPAVLSPLLRSVLDEPNPQGHRHPNHQRYCEGSEEHTLCGAHLFADPPHFRHQLSPD